MKNLTGDKLENAAFFVYEQCLPDDGFGAFMVEHFKRISSPIHGLARLVKLVYFLFMLITVRLRDKNLSKVEIHFDVKITRKLHFLKFENYFIYPL